MNDPVGNPQHLQSRTLLQGCCGVRIHVQREAARHLYRQIGWRFTAQNANESLNGFLVAAGFRGG